MKTLLSLICVAVMLILAAVWIATGKENALLELSLTTLILGVQLQSAIDSLQNYDGRD